MALQKYYWARLAPYNPAVGNVVRRHVFQGQLFVGGERPTWYRVKLDVAQCLVTLRQNDSDPRSPMLFEILDDAQRREADTIEDERALVKMGLHAATAPRLLTPPSDMDLTAGLGEKATALPGRAFAIPTEPSGPVPLTSEALTATVTEREELRISPGTDRALTTQDVPSRDR